MEQARVKNAGMTLIEILLVLVIASFLLVLGLRQYQFSQAETDAYQLKIKIDQLFQAMAHMYQSSCQIKYNQSTGAAIPGTGALDPKNNPSDPAGYSIATLQSLGYLLNWQPLNNIVDNTAPGQGYAIQFNRAGSDSMRYVNTCWSWDNPQCQTPQAMNTLNPAINANNVIIWRIQIAVAIKNANQVNEYKNMLGADCVSSLTNNNPPTVAPCRTGPPAGNYLVWERLPSFASPIESNSELWISMPYVKEFNQQYTHDVMYELSNPSWGTNPQNYLCGG